MGSIIRAQLGKVPIVIRFWMNDKDTKMPVVDVGTLPLGTLSRVNGDLEGCKIIELMRIRGL